MKKFFYPLKNYGRALKVLFRHNLAGYLFIPGLLTFVLFVLFVSLGIIFIDDLAAYIQGHLPEWEWIQSKAANITMDILLGILAFLVFLISFKQVVLIVLSPVLGSLSEKVEAKLAGVEPPKVTFKDMMNDIGRGLIINIVNLGLELILVFFAWLLGFIPIIGFVLSPVLIFLIQSFFGGFGLADYTLERKRFTIGKSNGHAYKNMAEMMGIGSGFLLIMFIPLIGWFFAPTLGTVAATLVTLENLNGEPIDIDGKKKVKPAAPAAPETPFES